MRSHCGGSGAALLALLFMRLERLPLRETARLRRPGQVETLLALAIVPGLWVAGVTLNLLAALALGYTTPVTPSQFPRTALEALALAATTVIAAPVCEELMFRGYVQRAYERRSIWVGIAVGGVIFALYHLRFQGLLALIPVALGLGYVAWRTGSLLPPMLMHAAYNLIATVMLIGASFLPQRVTGALTGTLACFGVLAAPFSVAALWLLHRRTDPAPSPAPSPRGRFAWVWTLPAAACSQSISTPQQPKCWCSDFRSGCGYGS